MIAVVIAAGLIFVATAALTGNAHHLNPNSRKAGR